MSHSQTSTQIGYLRLAYRLAWPHQPSGRIHQLAGCFLMSSSCNSLGSTCILLLGSIHVDIQDILIILLGNNYVSKLC